MKYLKRNIIGGNLFEALILTIDHLSFIIFYQYYYKKYFKHYGTNIRWGRNFRRKVIPSSIRISCPEKISIFDNVQIDEGVYLQCHEDGEGITIGEGSRINAHTHLLAFDLICLEQKVLIAPFCLLTSGNHGRELNQPIMKNPMERSGIICLGHGSWIGQGAVILGNTKLGKNTTVGAHAIVKGIFADSDRIVGNSIQKQTNRRSA